MRFSANSLLRLPPPRRRISRYLLAIGFCAGATLLRLVADPVLHNQVPYFIYVGAVVFATWFTGVEGGILCTVVATFAGNYFFVDPRYDVTFSAEDSAAMGLFAALALFLVWSVGHWRQAATAVRQLQERTEQIVRQLPVGVVVADASGTMTLVNAAAERIFRATFEGARMTVAEFRERSGYRALRKDGSAIPPEEATMFRAMTGERVAHDEGHLVWPDGTRTIVSAHAAPLRDAEGQISGAVLGMIDITGQETAAMLATQRAEELQTVLDTVPAVVFITDDPEARRISGNRAASEMLRVSHGANLSKSAPREERPDTFRFMSGGMEVPASDLPVQRAARGLETHGSELDVVYSDGTRRTLFGNARALRDGERQVRGAVAAFVDITERKRLETELRRRMDELAQANRVKDEFLSVLSHELRTPLNAILGWSELLLRHALDAATTQKAMEAIHRNARAQTGLINEVLDVSRIVSGKMRLEVRPIDLTIVVQAALDSIKPAADAKRIEITSSIAPQSMLVADPDRLQQIVWNLLSNSVKFSHVGGRIDVTVSHADSHVELLVRDNGMGIDADFLPHVFERFRQRDTSTTRAAQSGLGLGLAIVRHLVELHGGTVRAHSDGEGQGAEFVVALPVRAVFERETEAGRLAQQLALPDAPPVADDALANVRVVIVDDHADARTLLESVLRRVGAEVIVCASGEEALRVVQREQVDVVVADIGMPEMDGYEMMRRLRALPACASMPAIALTAFGGPEDRKRALEVGYHQHMAKPVTPDALVAGVASVLRSADSGSAGG